MMKNKGKPKATLLDRFLGKEGKRRCAEEIARQRIVENNQAVANALNAGAELVYIEADAPNNVCISEGCAENDIYLILAGEVSIRVNGHEMAVRTAGQHVGEMALLDSSKPRCATVVALKPTVLAKISEAKFTPVANKHPRVWRAMAKELAERLRERNKHVKMPNPRPVLFIGSSAEQRYVAQEIRDGLAREDMVTNVWTDDLFRPSKTSIENLEKELARSDFAAMLITPDDVSTSRRRRRPAPRDNVIWEHGLFLGGIGRERVYLVRPIGMDVKLPSDLLGVTPLEYQPKGTDADLRARLGPVINGIRKEIKERGVYLR